MSTNTDWTSHIDIDPDRVYGFNLKTIGRKIVYLHPWTESLEALAEWLESNWELPHGVLIAEPFDGANLITKWFESQPSLVFKCSCEECNKLFTLRFRYKQERSQ